MGSQTVTLKIAAWEPAHHGLLAAAMAHDPTTGTATLEALVKSQRAALFDVMQGNRRIGAVVQRIELCERGPEGVIVAAAGRLRGARLLADVLPILERHFIGVRWVRIHTARAGMVRSLTTKRHGYQVAETVLRKELKP